MTSQEKHFVTHVLSFFAACDGIRPESLAAQFSADARASEGRALYGFWMAMENVHSETVRTAIRRSSSAPPASKRLSPLLARVLARLGQAVSPWLVNHALGFANIVPSAFARMPTESIAASGIS